MAASTVTLPVVRTETPTDAAGVAEVVRDAAASGTPVYPFGGGTALDYGLPTRVNGIGLALTGLDRVVDYPARDLTVTVEAGMTIAKLAELLGAEQQELPFDVPHCQQATVGGVVATNWNGPRRWGLGAIRDFVIGISAVDGRGQAFKGGGRVVKNVAGYDFCKLLTGSLGALGVITQLTFKLRPRAERRSWVAGRVADLETADRLVEQFVRSATSPVAVKLVGGASWETSTALRGGASRGEWALIVGYEGTAVEVEWQVDRLRQEWRASGTETALLEAEPAADCWRRLVEFPAESASPLILKASLAPSGVTRFIAAVRAIDPAAEILADAGTGVVFARHSEFPAGGLTRTLLAQLHPVAAAAQGKVIIVSNPSGAEATRQSVWGGVDASFEWMQAVKRQFDPRNVLNPGRFVFP